MKEKHSVQNCRILVRLELRNQFLKSLILCSLANHDKTIDAERATTCRRNFRAPSLQTKITKNAGPSESDFHGKTVGQFQTK